MMKKPIYLVAVIAIFLVGAVVFYFFNRPQNKLEVQKKSLPTPRMRATTETIPSTATQTVVAIKKELNLAVPFTSQAPTGNWDHQHEEDCEEASMLMVNRFFTNQAISGTQDAEDGMAQLVDWENRNLGVSDSITAEQTAMVAGEFLNLKTQLIEKPTAEQIKEAVAQNKLVLVPAAGRELGNPFYTAPGPLYHMLVVKGYTEKQFITNDPGTRNGENYPYNFDKIMSANHDWNGGDVSGGVRRMVIVWR